MTNKQYEIQYSATFIKQLERILNYIVNHLKNKIAAENLLQEVKDKIKKHSENPKIYEKYNSTKKRKNIYYKIHVKNYTIFYTVKGDKIIVSRILYSKRDLENWI